MHRRPRSVLVAAVSVLAAAAAAASPAGAHQGNPNFRSVIRTVTPATPGVSLDILNLDDRLELTNHSAETVVVGGYNDEPYIRIRPDGTVQVNANSPAKYLNQDRYGRERAPAFATATATPRWQTVDKTGRYEWHDHRIHYMAQGVPPQVKDKGVRTTVFRWTVPLTVGARTGAVAGTLFWQPRDDGGPPVAAIAGLVALLAAAVAFVVVIRRRREEAGGDGDDAAGDGDDAARTPAEAW